MAIRLVIRITSTFYFVNRSNHELEINNYHICIKTSLALRNNYAKWVKLLRVRPEPNLFAVAALNYWKRTLRFNTRPHYTAYVPRTVVRNVLKTRKLRQRSVCRNCGGSRGKDQKFSNIGK